MKKTLIFLFTSIFILSCTDDGDEISININNDNISTYAMLHFENKDDLRLFIENDNSTRSTFNKPLGFISLMDIKEGTRSTENKTYYEAFGYDTLVPNEKFAELLNIKGEVSVANKIAKITPEGTYVYDKDFQSNIDNFISTLSIDAIKSNPDEIINLSDKVQLIKTFDGKEIESINNEEFSDDYFDSFLVTKATRIFSEPDYDSFQNFSADRGGIFGKLIQSIIGSTKASTINYSKKRRLRGSFYFYNYGVYSEIGVQGWTDKKNWIGWSKTESDELRVSWRNVIIKKTVPDYYKQSWDALRKQGEMTMSNNDYNKLIQYFPPQRMTINNRNVYAITITVTDIERDKIKDMIVKEGTKQVFNYLKNTLKRPASEMDQAEALVIASRTQIYTVYNSEEVKKFNVKKYTHVFANSWMNITLGWSNTQGINFNGINSSNIQNPKAYLDVLSKAFNEKKPELIGGQVTVCARLRDVWKGMNITKK